MDKDNTSCRNLKHLDGKIGAAESKETQVRKWHKPTERKLKTGLPEGDGKAETSEAKEHQTN